MDIQRLKRAYRQLESLDDRLSYKIRPGNRSLHRANLDQLNQKQQHLAEFTLELKEILRDVLLACATPNAAAKKEPSSG